MTSRVTEPFSLVFIPAISSVRSLNVSWTFVPFPASLSISVAIVSPTPFMVSGVAIVCFTMFTFRSLVIKEFRLSQGQRGLVCAVNIFLVCLLSDSVCVVGSVYSSGCGLGSVDVRFGCGFMLTRVRSSAVPCC